MVLGWSNDNTMTNIRPVLVHKWFNEQKKPKMVIESAVKPLT